MGNLDKNGFSLLEVIIAMTIMTISFMAFLGMYINFNNTFDKFAQDSVNIIDYDNLYDFIRGKPYDEINTTSDYVKYGDELYYKLDVKEYITPSEESFKKDVEIKVYDKNKKYITSIKTLKIRLKGYGIEVLNSSLLGDNYMTLWLSTNDKVAGTYYISKLADGSWGARYSINALMDTHNKYYYVHVKVENKEGPCETDYGLMGSITVPESSKYRFTYAGYGRTADATVPSHWRASNTSFGSIGYEPTYPVQYYSGAWGWGLWSSGSCHKSAYFTTVLERTREDSNEF